MKGLTRLEWFEGCFVLIMVYHIRKLVQEEVIHAFLVYPSIHFSFFSEQSFFYHLVQPWIVSNFIQSYFGIDNLSYWMFFCDLLCSFLMIWFVSLVFPKITQNFLHSYVVFKILRILSSFGCCIMYWSLFFSEKGLYNNHHYLYGNILTLFFISHLLSGRFRDIFITKILQYQISIVYIFAGITKLISIDWIIHSEPLKTWFFQGSPFWKAYIWRLDDDLIFNYPIDLVGNSSFISDENFESTIILVSFIMSWMSLIIDLLGGLLLLFSPSKLLVKISVCLFFIFHLCNFIFFDIGTFPITMIASCILWWYPFNLEIITIHQCKKYFNGIHFYEKLITCILILFIILHFIVPLRFIVYSNDINWTKSGHYYSWRMMINQEDTLTNYIVKESNNSNEYLVHSYIDESSILKIIPHQRKQIGIDPMMMKQFAQKYVKPISISKLHLSNSLKVFVNSWRSVNNQPFQRWVKSDINILDFEENCYFGIFCSHSHWINENILKEYQKELSQYSYDNIRKYWNEMGYECILFVDGKDENLIFTIDEFADEILVFTVSGSIGYYNYITDGNMIMNSTSNSIMQIPFNEQISIDTLSKFSLFGFAFKNSKFSFNSAIAM